MRETTFDQLSNDGQLAFGDGYRTNRSELDEEGVPILRVAEVKEGHLEPTLLERISSEYEPRFATKSSQVDDVVLTTKGTIGRVARITADTPRLVYSPQLCWFRCRPNGDLLPRYLYYWLQSPEFRRQALAVQGQTDMADYINLRDLGRLRLSLPDLSEQRRVVGVLAALDDKIDLNRRMCDTLDDLANLDFRLAATQQVPALEVLCPVLGGTPSRSEDSYWRDGTIPWATAKDVAATQTRAHVLLKVAENITEAGLQGSAAKVVPSGTTLITSRGTVGTITRTLQPMAFNQTCYALLPVEDFPSSLLFRSIRTAVQELRRMSHGSIFSTINKATFGSIALPVPPDAALNELDARMKSVDSQIAALTQECLTLKELRDALMPKLLSGELRVREAEEAIEVVV